MRLPEPCLGVVEWAYPGDAQVPCLRRVGRDQMLCGLFLNPGPHTGFVPTSQPENPSPVCPQCWERVWMLLGDCPVCGVELVADGAGRTPAHGGCVGVNMPMAGPGR